MPNTKRHIFTPIVDNERIKIFISTEDHEKIRRGEWKATIKDLDSDDVYEAWGMACSLPTCFCDAGAKLIKNTKHLTKGNNMSEETKGFETIKELTKYMEAQK